MYAKIENDQIVQYPYSTSQLFRSNPNVSFPSELSNDLLASFNVIRVIVTGQPAYDPMTETVVESAPVYNTERNRWEQQWSIVSLSAEEIQQRNDAKASSVRAERRNLLAACDWTQIDDSPLSNVQKAAWATYRQSLRDISAQTGFPWTIDWPVAP